MFWKKWKNMNEIDVNPIEPNITGEAWYNHFSNLHNENDGENAIFRKNYNTKDNYNTEFNQPFSKLEFEDVTKKLQTGKAEGHDSISNEMIKHAPPIIIELLLEYINLCLEKSLVSQQWCFDIINTIHKEGSINDPNNYRGISISSALLKIVCSLLNNRLKAFCSKHNMINNNQIGFKPNSRTSDHILTLRTLVKKYVTIGKKKAIYMFRRFQKGVRLYMA